MTLCLLLCAGYGCLLGESPSVVDSICVSACLRVFLIVCESITAAKHMCLCLCISLLCLDSFVLRVLGGQMLGVLYEV